METIMIKERFIRCSQCNKVHNFTEYDDRSIFEFDERKNSFIEKSVNDGKSFLMQHYGHEMQELRKHGENFIEGRSYSDPFKTVYYNVTNGLDRFRNKKTKNASGFTGRL
jgi:hypothetical protein